MNLTQGTAACMRAARLLTCVSLVAVLAACSSTPRAPVENRSLGGSTAPRVDPATLPGHEFAGKPGYYTVQQGETVRSIARANGVDWRDITRWNNNWVPNPDQIEVGQVLRVTPPAGASSASVAVAKPRKASGAAVAAPSRATSAESTTDVAEPVAAGALALAWPTQGGSVIAPYDGVKNKGIGISGKEGDAVMAAADGKVIYAGSGLRGYGNLVIVQHSGGYLTVYAHNSKLLVKEEQTVKKGQHIADMGKTDADRVKLHFEVRRGGKTMNPTSLLPAR